MVYPNPSQKKDSEGTIPSLKLPRTFIFQGFDCGSVEIELADPQKKHEGMTLNKGIPFRFIPKTRRVIPYCGWL